MLNTVCLLFLSIFYYVDLKGNDMQLLDLTGNKIWNAKHLGLDFICSVNGLTWIKPLTTFCWDDYRRPLCCSTILSWHVSPSKQMFYILLLLCATPTHHSSIYLRLHTVFSSLLHSFHLNHLADHLLNKAASQLSDSFSAWNCIFEFVPGVCFFFWVNIGW